MSGQDSRVCGCCGRKRAAVDSDYVEARRVGSCCSGTTVRGMRGAVRVSGCGGQCYGSCSVRRYPRPEQDAPAPDEYQEPLGPYSYGPPNAYDVAAGNEAARDAILSYRDAMFGRR